MKSTRVLFVCQRFWPHVGHDRVRHLMHLSTGLAGQGFKVDVVTPKLSPEWTERFQYRDVTVYRPLIAPRRDWTISRYTRQLTQWLRQAADSYDVMMVDSIREEAIAAIEACRNKPCKVVLRMRSDGNDSDEAWWARNRASKRCAAIGRMADAVLVGDADQQRVLLTHGFSDSIIRRMGNTVLSVPDRSDVRCRQSRQSLQLANADLRIDPKTRVVLCHSPMEDKSGIRLLVDQIAPMITRIPDLAVWMIGDGRLRDKIFTRLRGDGVRESIAMPGSFAALDDLVQAADVYLQPGPTGLQFVLPSVIAGSLPIVAVDEPVLRNYFCQGLGEFVHWFDPNRPGQLIKQVESTLDQPLPSQEAAATLKRDFAKQHSNPAILDQYAGLIESLRSDSSKSYSTTGTTG